MLARYKMEHSTKRYPNSAPPLTWFATGECASFRSDALASFDVDEFCTRYTWMVEEIDKLAHVVSDCQGRFARANYVRPPHDYLREYFRWSYMRGVLHFLKLTRELAYRERLWLTRELFVKASLKYATSYQREPDHRMRAFREHPRVDIFREEFGSGMSIRQALIDCARGTAQISRVSQEDWLWLERYFDPKRAALRAPIKLRAEDPEETEAQALAAVRARQAAAQAEYEKSLREDSLEVALEEERRAREQLRELEEAKTKTVM
jgi:hypothetical protein